MGQQPDTMTDQGRLESGESSHSEKAPPTGLGSRLSAHFSQEVDVKKAWIPLLLLCFVTGILDGTIYNAYGSFVSMQTGNTVFVALGTSGQNNRPLGWARSLMSLGCFAIGSVVFSRLHTFMGGGRLRRTVTFSFFFQTVCVLVSAAIIEAGVIDGTYPSRHPPGFVDLRELIPVALLSFQAAGQIVNSRALGVSEVPTVVITSLLCDTLCDPKILARWQDNPKRNKRICAFLLTFVGAIVGGWVSKGSSAVMPSLWLVFGLKALVTISWLGWKRKE